MVAEVLSRKEQVEAVVQILSSSHGLPEDCPFAVSTPGFYLPVGSTHKPIFKPTIAHACCRAFSSCATDSFPRCFSDRYWISEDVKYAMVMESWSGLDLCLVESRCRTPPEGIELQVEVNSAIFGHRIRSVIRV